MVKSCCCVLVGELPGQFLLRMLQFFGFGVEFALPVQLTHLRVTQPDEYVRHLVDVVCVYHAIA